MNRLIIAFTILSLTCFQTVYLAEEKNGVTIAKDCMSEFSSLALDVRSFIEDQESGKTNILNMNPRILQLGQKLVFTLRSCGIQASYLEKLSKMQEKDINTCFMNMFQLSVPVLDFKNFIQDKGFNDSMAILFKLMEVYSKVKSIKIECQIIPDSIYTILNSVYDNFGKVDLSKCTKLTTHSLAKVKELQEDFNRFMKNEMTEDQFIGVGINTYNKIQQTTKVCGFEFLKVPKIENPQSMKKCLKFMKRVVVQKSQINFNFNDDSKLSKNIQELGKALEEISDCNDYPLFKIFIKSFVNPDQQYHYHDFEEL